MRDLHSHLREYEKMFLRRMYFSTFAKFVGEFILVRIHAGSVFAPVRIQDKIPGELFMYWFCARG